MSINSSLDMGRRIKKQRESYKYTREQFAEIIQLSPVFLAGIENGSKGMSITTLEKMCKSLHVSTDYILFGKDTQNFDEVLEILSNVDNYYVPILVDVVKAFVKGLDQSKAAAQKNKDNA